MLTLALGYKRLRQKVSYRKSTPLSFVIRGFNNISAPLSSSGITVNVLLYFRLNNWSSLPLQLRGDFRRSQPELFSDLALLTSSVSV